MKSVTVEAPVRVPVALPNNEPVPLASVLCTEELNKRARRPPDYAAENRALTALVTALADSPQTILQMLSDKILEVLRVGSAGVSLLTKEDGGKRFYWPAIAGIWKPHIGGGTPRDFGPCGDVLDRNSPLLFRHFERRYAYFLPVTPPVEECLLVPFYVEGKAVGTIWAIAHDKRRKFDAEDLRMLESLGRFASAAYQAVEAQDALQQHDDALRQNRADLSRRVAELQKANAHARGSRRAALNLMEDAVQSQRTMEKLNAELREGEERFRTLFDLGPIAIYSIDASGVIQDFNRRAAELWGRKPAVGDTDERFCGSFKMFRPDGIFMPHDQCPMAEVVSGKTPLVEDAEVFIERPDGSRVAVLVNIRPLKNGQGEVTGAINCFYDITHRKKAEEALRQSQSRLAKELAATQRLQDTSTLLIHGGDIHALYQQILAAGIAITRSDMATLQTIDEEKHALRLLASMGFDSTFEPIFELNRPNSKTSWEVAMRNGQRVIVPDVEKCDFIVSSPALQDIRKAGIRAMQCTPLVSRSGRVIGMISTHWRNPHEPAERDLRLMDVLARQAADLIERKQGEEALDAAQKQLADRAVQLEQLVNERTARLQETVGELEHFSYSITHDMRAPLRAMQGFGQMLLRESGDRLTPTSADYVRRIIDASTRMDALIQDSLQYAKVVREKIPLTSLESALVLRGVLESYPGLQKPHVKIELVEPLPAVIANDAGLTQCFSNLLANAIKFVRPGKVPEVRIWAEPRGDFVRFWFEDNGIGIPREYQDRIFHMFQQLDRSYEGTGIGLALVRKTAERMDGKVGVESEPGNGSRFWLEFKKANPSI